jgi:NAD(P)-dependent dehydrogenase (short-subunit alcohol dehydrogenase family)
MRSHPFGLLYKYRLRIVAALALAMEVAPFGVKICTLEPGGIRTNWARWAGQDAPELLPDYEGSVGPLLKLLKSIEGRQEGDPHKIADLIFI